MSISPTFPRYVIKKAINDTVNAVGSSIYAAKVTTFTFNAARGAFTVLEFIAKIAKPLLWIGGLVAAIGAMWSNYKP